MNPFGQLQAPMRLALIELLKRVGLNRFVPNKSLGTAPEYFSYVSDYLRMREGFEIDFEMSSAPNSLD